ncbi:Uncharacterised protein [Raoultella planticola]|nr:Uncharacterised protein [Raoultella planticola]
MRPPLQRFQNNLDSFALTSSSQPFPQPPPPVFSLIFLSSAYRGSKSFLFSIAQQFCHFQLLPGFVQQCLQALIGCFAALTIFYQGSARFRSSFARRTGSGSTLRSSTSVLSADCSAALASSILP